MAPTALVTGATGAVGGALCAQLVDKGWRVLRSGRRSCADDDGSYFAADLVRRDEVDGLTDWVTRNVAEPEGLALVAHCAGQVNGEGGDDDANALHTYALHYLAFVRLVFGLSEQLTTARGLAAAVSSSSAQRFAPHQLHYGASKAALESAIRHLAHQLGPAGVRVVGVRPTLLDTPMAAGALSHEDDRRRLVASIPLGRLGRASDVADFLAVLGAQDPSTAWLSGQTIWLDGAAVSGWNEADHYDHP